MNVLEVVLRVVLFPFWLLFIVLPNWVDDLIFRWQSKGFRLTRPNCLLLVNAASGKKLGPRILAIAAKLNRGDIALDVATQDYIGRIRQVLHETRDPLHLILCGGDGTVSTTVDRCERELSEAERDRVIYVPMALGTGNDMSRSLNLGDKVRLNYVNSFFRRVDSPKSRVKLVDWWHGRVVSPRAAEPLLDKSFLLYMGVGYDAETAARFEAWRRRAPWLFKVNKVNKLYYGLIFLLMWLRDRCCCRGGDALAGSALAVDGRETDVGRWGNLMILTSYSRASGRMHEWNRQLDGRWAPQKMNDGAIETLGVDGLGHLMLSMLGCRPPTPVAQGRHLRLRVAAAEHQRRAFHVDGEGQFVTGPFELEVRHLRAVKFLCYDLPLEDS